MEEHKNNWSKSQENDPEGQLAKYGELNHQGQQISFVILQMRDTVTHNKENFG